MDHGAAQGPGGKIWKGPCWSEVPYTVQTHLISTLLCKLVSRRRGAGHIMNIWTLIHQQTGRFKKTCTSWLVCVILPVMKAQLSTFMFYFYLNFYRWISCLFFNHSYGLLKICCCSGMNLLQKAVYKVWPPLGNTSLHARSTQRALSL